MSTRNSQSNKSAARERIRAERERQKKKDRIRRQLVVAISVVGVLAVAGGIGFAVLKANEPTAWEAAKEAKVIKPAHTQGKDGTEILIGDKNAKETLEVFEDVRCPACAAFEQSSGETLNKDIKDGRYKVRFTMYAFIDGNAGGEGSKNALSALGAALNVSPDAFLKYKSALYSAKFHPDEREDVYGKDSELLKVAAEVPELKNNNAFATAVEKGTYDPWAMRMADLFGRKGVRGTPTFMHGDKKLVMDQIPQQQMTQAQYSALANANFKKMIDKEFGPAKGAEAGKNDGKGGDKDKGEGKGIREGEKDPTREN
ncbi:thioredoxin domain-containing protein [Streptomyces halobius]|uniref:DsbA family protein n=1 Tax=Streptomyces halobius TaxID=2879846 RepID=A0ABY4MI21_9ACTN|nr:thioredoxin domain-containing protein [Streptomyces halobius]UQA96011.1 DsbA family protein [Streptomyces halobius]